MWRMNAPRVAVLLAAVGLTLAACGTSEPVSDSDTTQPPAAEVPPTNDAPAASPATGTDPAGDPPITEPPPPEPSGTNAPADAPASEAPATEAPPAEPQPAPLGGRTFATSVEPAARFDGNPFPDLVVDDVGRGGEANIANILPSDRPVLLWTWAPH